MKRPRRLFKVERQPPVVRPNYRPPSVGPPPRQRDASAKGDAGDSALIAAVLAGSYLPYLRRRLPSGPIPEPPTEAE